jgi:hypothetical protein
LGPAAPNIFLWRVGWLHNPQKIGEPQGGIFLKSAQFKKTGEKGDKKIKKIINQLGVTGLY